MSIYVGVVGSGVGKRLHIPVLAAIEGCVPIGLSHTAIAADSLAPWRRPAPPTLDWLVVATPPSAHVEYVAAGLGAGARVLCEKPVGVTAAAARALLRDHAGADDVLVNFQLRFYQPLVRCAQAAATASELEMRYISSARRRPGMPTWYRRPELGGGVILAVGVHFFDLVHTCGRRFERVRAETIDQTDAPAAALDAVRVEGVLEDGGRVRLVIDCRGQAASFGLTVDPANGWLDLVTGRVTSQLIEHPPEDATGHASLSSRAPKPWRAAQRAFYGQLFDHQPSADVEARAAKLVDAIRAHEVASACVASLRRAGSWSAVPRS